MRVGHLTTIVVIGCLGVGSANTYAAENRAENQGIKLSADLRDLLRAEMREIATGVQGVALALATGDWQLIQETSTKIQASYIMEKSLTPAQAGELEKALPEQFRQLDAEFHQRAEKLGVAAAAHDAELVAFQYSRLVESCARCHSMFASHRFPGFSSRAPQDHRH
jgi:cytochrome c556